MDNNAELLFSNIVSLIHIYKNICNKDTTPQMETDKKLTELVSLLIDIKFPTDTNGETGNIKWIVRNGILKYSSESSLDCDNNEPYITEASRTKILDFLPIQKVEWDD